MVKRTFSGRWVVQFAEFRPNRERESTAGCSCKLVCSVPDRSEKLCCHAA